MNCVIVDDEKSNIENLSLLLNRYVNNINIVGTAQNTDEAIALIDKLQPDLVFLDIEMPGRNGFEVLKAFNKPPFDVIFVTAYDQYGIKAIKFSALDYLLKPIDVEELKQAIEKAAARLLQKKDNHSIGNLLSFLKQEHNSNPRIALPGTNEIRYVNISEVVRCESSNNYTFVYLTGGEKILVSRSLKEFADLLASYHFIRTHQSHLVNAGFVKSYLREDGGTVLMKDHTRIPVSRQNRDIVKQQLQQF